LEKVKNQKYKISLYFSHKKFPNLFGNFLIDKFLERYIIYGKLNKIINMDTVYFLVGFLFFTSFLIIIISVFSKNKKDKKKKKEVDKNFHRQIINSRTWSP